MATGPTIPGELARVTACGSRTQDQEVVHAMMPACVPIAWSTSRSRTKRLQDLNSVAVYFFHQSPFLACISVSFLI
jgi:hypothetical protein